MTTVNVSRISGRTIQASYLGAYTGPGALSIGTVDTDDAVNQYQQSVTIPLTNFSEEITAVTLNSEACTIQSQVIGTSVTVDFPGNPATGTYTLSVSGATESATKSIDYTQTHPYTSPVGAVDSNSLFSSPVLITAGTYHRIVSGPSNGALDAAGAESGNLWANDVADIYTPNEGFTGTDSVQIEVLFDDGTTDTINATITVETPVDTTPDQFDLGANVTGAEPGATVQRTFVLAGIDPGETVSPSATGSATVSPGTAQAGDTITVELTAGTFEAVVSGGVSINGVSDSFSVTSRAAVLPTQDVVLPDLNLGETDAVSIDLDNYFSGASSYTLTGIPADSGLSFSGSVLSGNVNKDDIAASPFTLTATAFSADGSINDSFSVTVVDDIAPVISINPLTTLETAPIVSGSAGDATSLTLVVTGVGTYNPTPSGGTWSQQLPTLSLGEYSMTLNGEDGAGNAAIEASATLRVVDELSNANSILQPVLKSILSHIFEDIA